MRVNFADTELKAFEAAEPGWYLCDITDTEMKEAGERAKNPGSEYIKYEFTVVEPTENAGKKFFANASLLPNALYTLKAILVAVGEEAEGELDINPDDHQGQRVAVKVNRYKFDDDWQNGVKRIEPPEVYYEKRKDAGESSLLPS